jgi:hypothetical protein
MKRCEKNKKGKFIGLNSNKINFQQPTIHVALVKWCSLFSFKFGGVLTEKNCSKNWNYT